MEVRGKMRGLSPILSTVILVMATLAAGAIMYQYFMNTIRNVADKPLFYAYDARYLPELGVIYVSADNNGDYSVNVTKAEITCNDGTVVNQALNVSIDAGSSYAIRIPAQCTPSVIVLHYTYKGKQYTTEPIRVS
jgi:flagellin-like protein